MNWRERFLQITLLVMLFWAVNIVVSWGISYFFPVGERQVVAQNDTTAAVAGSCYQAPTVAEVQQPLNREIDFFDADLDGSAKEFHTILNGPRLQYDFSSYGAVLQDAVYSHQIEERVEDMRFVHNDPLAAREEGLFLVALDVPSPYIYEKGVSDDAAVFFGRVPQATITKRFTAFKDASRIDLELTVEPLENKSVRPRIFVAAPQLSADIDWDRFPAFVIACNGKMQKVYAKKIAQAVWAQPDIIGVQDRYFSCALVDDVTKFVRRGYFWQTPSGRPGFILEGPAIEKKTTWRLSFYCGPKETATLAAVDKRLEALMEYGWFARISQVMLWLLNFFNRGLGNYGWAIVFLTLLLNLLIAPFSIKSILSEDKMAARQRDYSRRLAAIRKKYADDPEQFRLAQMELLKEQGFAGMGGGNLLPVFIQMPFFIGLNRVLANAIQLHKAPFILWIHDLSQPDIVLPWLLGGLMLTMMLVGLKKSNKKIQPTSLLVVLFFVFLFGGIGFKLSTGLNLFIIVGLIFRLLLTFVVKRMKKLWMVSHR